MFIFRSEAIGITVFHELQELHGTVVLVKGKQRLRGSAAEYCHGSNVQVWWPVVTDFGGNTF